MTNFELVILKIKWPGIIRASFLYLLMLSIWWLTVSLFNIIRKH